MSTYRVKATVHHGHYFEDFEVLADSAADLMVNLFDRSTYMPHHGADRFTKAERIWASLVETGKAEFGWVRYTATIESVTCRHCGRTIEQVEGAWIDPEATGDDSVWRETCDEHDTFVADHEPEA